MRGLPTLLTPGQAAARLGVEEDRLTVWRTCNRGPARVEITGRIIRYETKALDQFAITEGAGLAAASYVAATGER